MYFSVGLTGGIGSGKTTVANLFAERGAEVIDADEIAHQLTVTGGAAIEAIRFQFGPESIQDNGSMSRAFMREKVFKDTDARKKLEAILHPMIRQQSLQMAEASTKDYVIFVVPLLVEQPVWQKMIKRILVVDCSEDLQIKRVIERNKMNTDQVRAIMAAQATREARLELADDVIVNERGLAELVSEVDKLHVFYKKLAKKSF